MIEDRRHMSLMARNDDDGTFTKLAVLNVNLVGTVADLRRDISQVLLGSKWKQKFILMKETLKDIPEDGEEKLTVTQIYSSDCVLMRWEPIAGKRECQSLCTKNVNITSKLCPYCLKGII